MIHTEIEDYEANGTLVCFMDLVVIQQLDI